MYDIVGGLSTEVASSPDDKKTKKNRCTTCKKKVGLTGNSFSSISVDTKVMSQML